MITDLLRPGHLLLLILLFILIFGTKRLPEFAKAIGKSMRTLKEELNMLTEHETDKKAEKPSKKNNE